MSKSKMNKIHEAIKDNVKSKSSVDLVLSEDVLRRLREKVAFRTVGDVQGLVADALNTYMHLGQLSAGGVEIFARRGEDGQLVRLRFPFDASAAKSAEEAA